MGIHVQKIMKKRTGRELMFMTQQQNVEPKLESDSPIIECFEKRIVCTGEREKKKTIDFDYETIVTIFLVECEGWQYTQRNCQTSGQDCIIKTKQQSFLANFNTTLNNCYIEIANFKILKKKTFL